MAKRRVVAGKHATDQVFHGLSNNFAAISLWATMLAKSACDGCRAVHEQVAGAIGRNLAEAQVSCRRLRALATRAQPPRAAMNGRRRRRAS